MKIQINGQDKTPEIEAKIREGIRSRKSGAEPGEISPEIGALRLQEAKSETEYQELLLRLMRYRDNVDTLPFDIPRRPGFLGAIMARVRVFLWKLLRYQHDRVTSRQNLINSTLSGAIEFEHRLRKQELDELRKRVADLESRLGQRT
ncbi:MAG: hypothetical protein V1873_02170 [Verrucomicrobiota bacterium]